MKQLIILYILFFTSLLSLFVSKDEKNTYRKLILSLLLVFIIINVNIKINLWNDKFVYINILLLILLILNLIIKRDKKVINIKSIILFLNITNIIYILQMIFIRIYDINLFVYSFSTNLIILLIIIIFYKFQGRFNKDFIIKSIAIIAFINFILGLLQYKTGKMLIYGSLAGDIYYTEGISIVKRVVGFVGASNGAGNLGAILFPVVLYKFNNKRNLLNLIYIFAVLIFTIMTLTRIAYVAIIIEFLIFFIMNNNKKDTGHKVLFICVFFIASIIIYNIYFNNIYNILFTERGSTESVRIEQFLRVYKLFLQYPFLGVGTGQYTYFILDIFSIKDTEIHSQILNTFVECGFLGGFAYLIFNIRLMIMAVKSIPRVEVWFVLSLFIGNLIVSNFNPNQYYSIDIFIYYFILCGIIFAARGEHEKTFDN